jgi:PIN domain nuclease of toxin-antitoxin system
LKILLDTTYLIPAIGISIKGMPTDTPIKLIAKGNEIFISQITIFELSAKGAKYIKEGVLTPETVTRGIRAIVYNDEMQTIPTHDSKMLLTAFKIRSRLTDFIDCLILASAITQCDMLITEDTDIQDLAETTEFNNLLATENPNFKIQNLANVY